MSDDYDDCDIPRLDITPSAKIRDITERLRERNEHEKTILDAYATILVPHKLFDDAVRLLRTEFSIKSRVQTATIGETQDD